MELVNKVVAVSIGLFVAAILMPLALVTMANTTWYSVDPAVIIVITVLMPILAVIGIALYFLREG